MTNSILDDPKSPTAKEWLDELSAIRLFVIINQVRGIIRPSARRDLQRYIRKLHSRADVEELIRWGGSVLEADFEERYFLNRPKTEKAVRTTGLEIFRRPERAFQVRWMHISRNSQATRLAIKELRQARAPRASSPKTS